jgi:short-subunit dehydrogenase
MVEQGSGHIVNTASMAGLVPVFGEVSYVTSKHGVVGLSLALRIEGALHGVKVSVVCPGFIRTPIYDSIELIKLDREALMEMAPRGASVDKAAQVILEDVERNRAVIVPPRQARALWWLNRAFPILTIKFLHRVAATMFKKTRVKG